jgi:Papain family cysteine protease
MKGHKRGKAWAVSTNSVPKELLQALPRFIDPVETVSAHESLLFKSFAEITSAPAQLRCDWRESGVLPVPAFQGKCNACTSFAIAAAVEVQHYIKLRTRIRLAPGFIHSCLLGRTCQQGAGVKESLDASAAHGIALGFPGDYPYPITHCSTTNLYRVGQRVRTSSANEAMVTILNHGPIVADMFIDPSFVSLPSGAVYSLQDQSSAVLHSVCVVGFDQPNQYWIVMNSYGQNWSEGGFGRVAFNSGGLLSERAGWQVIL